MLGDRIDADLMLGLHTSVVAELEIVREQPLRERLGRQLMLALYRCQRRPTRSRSTSACVVH